MLFFSKAFWIFQKNLIFVYYLNDLRSDIVHNFQFYWLNELNSKTFTSLGFVRIQLKYILSSTFNATTFQSLKFSLIFSLYAFFLFTFYLSLFTSLKKFLSFLTLYHSIFFFSPSLLSLFFSCLSLHTPSPQALLPFPPL